MERFGRLAVRLGRAWVGSLSGGSGASWHRRYGSWWMLQWAWAGWLSFGVHLDFRHRLRGDGIHRYGPYVDFHLGVVILSLGWRPVYAFDFEDLRSSVAIMRELG